MNEYEEKLTNALRKQFGAEWYLIDADPHHLRDYVRATTDSERAHARRAMESQTLYLMHGFLQAGLLAGVVTPTDGA